MNFPNLPGPPLFLFFFFESSLIHACDACVVFLFFFALFSREEIRQAVGVARETSGPVGPLPPTQGILRTRVSRLLLSLDGERDSFVNSGQVEG